MASQLSTIVDAIAAMSVPGFAIPVLRGTTIKNQVEDADVPTRILSAVGMASSRTGTKTLGGSGHVMSTEWTITDIALLRVSGTGRGLRDKVGTMESYLAAYHEAVRVLSSPTWYLFDIRCRAQVFEWPQASGRNFDAVVATLLVREIIQ